MKDTPKSAFEFPPKKELLQYQRLTARKFAQAAFLIWVLFAFALPTTQDFKPLLATLLEISFWISSRPGGVVVVLFSVGVLLGAKSLRTLYSLMAVAQDGSLSPEERCDKAVGLYKGLQKLINSVLAMWLFSWLFVPTLFAARVVLNVADPLEAFPSLLWIFGWAIPFLFARAPLFTFLIPAELRKRICEQLPPHQSKPALSLMNATIFVDFTYGLDNYLCVVMYLMAARDGTTTRMRKSFHTDSCAN